ncbi:hypothetical protein QVD17_39975 [Tagetes erecta]|uniref:Uncharacterized protein n=1 Tax=Tagetes erecta TaxID=13708 RepID=A0AAD8JRQ8_TARER|nr:hypothetical protein QVD17_39975 [Tagetes erecta]
MWLSQFICQSIIWIIEKKNLNLNCNKKGHVGGSISFMVIRLPLNFRAGSATDKPTCNCLSVDTQICMYSCYNTPTTLQSHSPNHSGFV